MEQKRGASGTICVAALAKRNDFGARQHRRSRVAIGPPRAACRVWFPPKPAALNRRTRAMDGSGGAVDRYSVGSGNFSDVLSRIRDEDAVDESTDVIDLIRAKWINQRVKVR